MTRMVLRRDSIFHMIELQNIIKEGLSCIKLSLESCTKLDCYLGFHLAARLLCSAPGAHSHYEGLLSVSLIEIQLVPSTSP